MAQSPHPPALSVAFHKYKPTSTPRHLAKRASELRRRLDQDRLLDLRQHSADLIERNQELRLQSAQLVDIARQLRLFAAASGE